ncbi:MAG: protein kinase [Cyanobacteria bacterium P01_D01_bin.36]
MSSTVLSNRYRVLSVLGDGGFGKTFLVEDIQMPSNRRCVLKQLKPIHNETPEIRQLVQDRFQREAAILEQLGETHAQIPCLYAYFSEDEQFYLVQEWIDGVTVAQKVQQEGPQSEAVVKAMLMDLLDVIAFIHSEGIVHRDIKPDNIILRRSNNQPVLIDFGAVKETMNTALNSANHNTRSIVVGTPGYMPSEQLSGRPVFASDLYSLGMSAIYMLIGKLPHELASDPASGQLLWRQHAPSITPSFGDFLETAIHTYAPSRFPSASVMKSALSALSVESLSNAATELSTEFATQTKRQSSIASSIPADSTAPEVSTISEAFAISEASTASAKPSSKNAFILGSLIGVSILVGAVVVVANMPEPTAAPVVDIPEEVPPAPLAVDAPELPVAEPEPALPSSTIPPEPVLSPAPSQFDWRFMGTASSGESVSVNANSIILEGDLLSFEYKIGEELILASADCFENQWYTELYGWYSPQSRATQEMLNFVCQ